MSNILICANRLSKKSVQQLWCYFATTGKSEPVPCTLTANQAFQC